MSRASHRGLVLLDQVYFVTDCVAWVLSGSRCPHLSKEEEGGLISAHPPPILFFWASEPSLQAVPSSKAILDLGGGGLS